MNYFCYSLFILCLFMRYWILSFKWIRNVRTTFITFLRFRRTIRRVYLAATFYVHALALYYLFRMTIDDFIKLGWRVFIKLGNLFQRRWGSGVKNNVLLIWLILMKRSEFKARRRYMGFMGIKDHLFDKWLFSGGCKVGLFIFSGFGVDWIHLGWEILY